MDIKTFEYKLDLNTAAYKQVKRAAKLIKPTKTDIGCSTAFTLDFSLVWGKDLFGGKQIDVKVESWGNKRIEIWGSEGVRPVRLPLTKTNVNKIYSLIMKAYKEME